MVKSCLCVKQISVHVKGRGNALHGGQMSQDDVHGVNGVSAQGFIQVQRLRNASPCQDFVQHVPADQRHKSNGDFKRAVLPSFSWQGDVQINLKMRGERDY